MTSLRRIAMAALAVLVVTPAGCVQPLPTEELSLKELIQGHNTNANQVEQLWARVRMEIVIANPDGGLPMTWGSASPLATPNGILMLFKGPDAAGLHDFVLIGREMGMDLFRIGVSREESVYYFWYKLGDNGAAYWGDCDHAGAPYAQQMAVNPLDLLAVLNVTAWPTDLTQLPAMALTMDTDPPDYAYVLNHIERQVGSRNILLNRRTHLRWSDSQPARPFHMEFIDGGGMTAMAADMGEYALPATFYGSANVTPDDPHVFVPTDIRITWPGNHSQIRLRLSEITTDPKGEPAACRFRDHLPAGMPQERIVRVDRPASRLP